MPFCDPLASDAAVVSSTILYVYKFVMNAVSYCCYLWDWLCNTLSLV